MKNSLMGSKLNHRYMMGFVDIFYNLSKYGSQPGLAKTRVFYQKPTGEGLTGYIRVLLGLMGKMGNMKLSY